jgi:hypothetical protein
MTRPVVVRRSCERVTSVATARPMATAAMTKKPMTNGWKALRSNMVVLRFL